MWEGRLSKTCPWSPITTMLNQPDTPPNDDETDPRPDEATDRSALRVAVVGPCASGKSTLAEALRAAGYDARHPAQEHSFVPDMWQRLVNPDVLVYLDVDYAAYRARRPHHDPGPAYLDEQHRRLAHALTHADLVIDTSEITAEAVRTEALAFLASRSG